MIRKSTAIWRGDGLKGTGEISTQSGAFNAQPYSFKTRFQNEDGKAGTNPEELVGAAHAGCFSMALAFALTDAGHAPKELRVTANIDMAKDDTGFFIKTIGLEVDAQVPGIAADKFQTIAEAAKKNCPISRALAATPITLSAKLA